MMAEKDCQIDEKDQQLAKRDDNTAKEQSIARGSDVITAWSFGVYWRYPPIQTFFFTLKKFSECQKNGVEGDWFSDVFCVGSGYYT